MSVCKQNRLMLPLPISGVTESKSLKVVTLKTPPDSLPPEDIVVEAKQKGKRMVVRVNVNRSVSI